MPAKKREPQNMMDFILSTMNAEDRATAVLIEPLPADVQPSEEFLASMRAQLLQVIELDARRRQAA